MDISDEDLDRPRRCRCCERTYTLRQQISDRDAYNLDFGNYQDVWLDICFVCFETEVFDEDTAEEFNDCPFDEYNRNLVRTCNEARCGARYTIKDVWQHQSHYFSSPWDFGAGCKNYCLNCWLGIDPEDVAEDINSFANPSAEEVIPETQNHYEGSVASLSDEEVLRAVYPFLLDGNLNAAYKPIFDMGLQVIVMPLDRVRVTRVVPLPNMCNIFPAGLVDLHSLPISDPREKTQHLSEKQSAASQITSSVLSTYPLAVFPCRFSVNDIWRFTHEQHMELIRSYSELFEQEILNYVRFRECRLHRMEDLPCRPGQVPRTNVMMSAIAFYDGERREGYVIGGAAFNSVVTRGLGMDLSNIQWDQLPGSGGVGSLARRALALYAELLDTPSETSRFVQAMTLLEFLAYPDKFEKFQEVRKVIAAYFTENNSPESQKIAARFTELTHGISTPIDGEFDEKGKQKVNYIPGIRTRLVHHGDRLSQILPDPDERAKLFAELDGYIRPVIQHMIRYSGMSFSDYTKVRSEAFRHIVGR